MTTDEYQAAVLRELAAIRTLLARSAPAAKAAPVGEVASAADLDSQYGDPEVKFQPKKWSGESMLGRRYSECPAGFLDLLADALRYFAGKNDAAGAVDKNGKPKSNWDRMQAARAAGWAARARAGGVAAPTAKLALAQQPTPDFGAPADDDCPF